MRIRISNIELDTSIQCRATIDTGVVNDYAERMEEGDQFPDVVVFGAVNKCWIGDGWHRVLASKQVGYLEINAELRTGGRFEVCAVCQRGSWASAKQCRQAPGRRDCAS